MPPRRWPVLPIHGRLKGSRRSHPSTARDLPGARSCRRWRATAGASCSASCWPDRSGLPDATRPRHRRVRRHRGSAPASLPATAAGWRARARAIADPQLAEPHSLGARPVSASSVASNRRSSSLRPALGMVSDDLGAGQHGDSAQSALLVADVSCASRSRSPLWTRQVRREAREQRAFRSVSPRARSRAASSATRGSFGASATDMFECVRCRRASPVFPYSPASRA